MAFKTLSLKLFGLILSLTPSGLFWWNSIVFSPSPVTPEPEITDEHQQFRFPASKSPFSLTHQDSSPKTSSPPHCPPIPSSRTLFSSTATSRNTFTCTSSNRPPSITENPKYVYQSFNPDISITTANNPNPDATHVVSAFGDLSVTLDHPSSNLRYHLVRGSPFLTAEVLRKSAVSISTIHAILQISSNPDQTKFTIKLNNNQTWVLYASSPITLYASSLITLNQEGLSCLTTSEFTGIFRIAASPDSDPNNEATLDCYTSRYPLSSHAVLLFMLAHHLHLKLLSKAHCSFTVLENFKYKSIDGELVEVVGNSWVFEELTPIATDSSYFYGKLVARAARLALIAEEVHLDVIPAIRKFLKDAIEPWLDGKLATNGFLYDPKWGGIVTKQGSLDAEADFGFGLYNDHHYHLGYFVYGISVLTKIDHNWGMKYRPQAYSMMADYYMSLSRKADSGYTRVRCFDFWLLHSRAGGLTEFGDGRNQESTSEAINAYYSAALMGLAYGDTNLVSIGSTLTAFEIQATQTWWHVREGDILYGDKFTKENKVVGMVGQIRGIVPFGLRRLNGKNYAKQLVTWTQPALAREGVGEGWKGSAFALEAIYDKESALEKIRNLKGYDDGDSLTNLLWWIHSRAQGHGRGGRFSWEARHRMEIWGRLGCDEVKALPVVQQEEPTTSFLISPTFIITRRRTELQFRNAVNQWRLRISDFAAALQTAKGA
ncbi:OLC1v1019463C1 [Oldenlandia corymbosa var. corymbosa]|uniref:glucan endo-1,3-beta-D-glucosidase n=1 Tax=Oldenlandia corymbosa var. corymbosa TaxID=529605 RepID=A0AAV1EE74_OLDCO|nr:OLC1v1019463C1 [Oldenlandia corymbosa var. corymbosa]